MKENRNIIHIYNNVNYHLCRACEQINKKKQSNNIILSTIINVIETMLLKC